MNAMYVFYDAVTFRNFEDVDQNVPNYISVSNKACRMHNAYI